MTYLFRNLISTAILFLGLCLTQWTGMANAAAELGTQPYIQKAPAPCLGADMWKWHSCKATLKRSRPNSHNSTDEVFKAPGEYVGSVFYGSPKGWGIYTYQGGDRSGDIYIGYFNIGNFDGFGTYYHNAPNKLKGSMYIGNFRNHLKQGRGTYIYADGSPTQEGFWEKDRLVEPMSLKNVFFDTRAGLPFCEGTDVTKWTDCFGYFEFDSIPGQRLQQIYRIGDIAYAGGFKNGLPDGVGSFFGYRTNMSSAPFLDYQGGMKQGKFEGTGTRFDYNGDEPEYTGGFANGKKQGFGVHQYGKHSRVPMVREEGEFENDRLVKGTIYKEETSTYEGNLKNGEFHGKGRFTPYRRPGAREPVVLEGIWDSGKLLPPEKPPVVNSQEKKPPAVY